MDQIQKAILTIAMGNNMQRIVINKCYGGFGLSLAAGNRLVDLGKRTTNKKDNTKFSKDSKKWGVSNYDFEGGLERNDPLLVQVVEELGNEANGSFASLHIVEIPDEVEWEIEEYDGMEWVSEKHQTWS